MGCECYPKARSGRARRSRPTSSKTLDFNLKCYSRKSALSPRFEDSCLRAVRQTSNDAIGFPRSILGIRSERRLLALTKRPSSSSQRSALHQIVMVLCRADLQMGTSASQDVSISRILAVGRLEQTRSEFLPRTLICLRHSNRRSVSQNRAVRGNCRR